MAISTGAKVVLAAAVFGLLANVAVGWPESGPEPQTPVAWGGCRQSESTVRQAWVSAAGASNSPEERIEVAKTLLRAMCDADRPRAVVPLPTELRAMTR